MAAMAFWHLHRGLSRVQSLHAAEIKSLGEIISSSRKAICSGQQDRRVLGLRGVTLPGLTWKLRHGSLEDHEILYKQGCFTPLPCYYKE